MLLISQPIDMNNLAFNYPPGGFGGGGVGGCVFTGLVFAIVYY